MAKPRSYSVIYNVQRFILVVLYTTTAIALSIPLARLVTVLSPDHFYPLVITLLLYMVVVAVIGSMIYYISFIPFNLASSFDPIKNDIASGEISNLEQLGLRITEFTTQFFNYSFLDITHAFMHTPDGEIISHEPLQGIQDILEQFEMLEKTRGIEEIILAGQITLAGRDYQLYILPIWFGNRWLGYMGLCSEKKIRRFFQRFLEEYENNFLDDQIMHVLPAKNS